MAVFIELTTDAFASVFQNQADGRQDKRYQTNRAGKNAVRRPTRGLEVKNDTYAFIKVIQANGNSLPLVDSTIGTGQVNGVSNFILQQVVEKRMEKHKIVETFGETYVFFFGEAPRFLTINAILINSHDFNWEAEWWENYERYFRGTKLAELGARVYLFYDDNVVEGYMLQCQATKMSQEPHQIAMAFQFFVTNYTNISNIGSGDFPVRSSIVLPDDASLTDGNIAEKLVALVGGASMDQATQDNLNQQPPALLANSPGPFAEYKKITDTFRAVARSFAVAPDVQLAIAQLQPAQTEFFNKLITRFGKPLREKIIANVDEFTGGDFLGATYPWFEFGKESGIPSALSHIVRSQQESDNLFREMIEFLSCFGADINNPSALNDLGVGPNFGVGAFAGASASVSFGAKASGGFGFSASASAVAGIGASFGGKVDPLGAVFGPPGSSKIKDPRFSEGAGDPAYGYASAFGGVGFGQAGFGDYGGSGFGSGFGSSGDPGHKDPSKFTYAGVSSEKDAIDRFLTPKEDQTSLSSGGFGFSASASAVAGVGATGAFAKAQAKTSLGDNTVTAVGGSPSPFALISVQGTLNVAGTARQDPKNASGREQVQAFGIAPDNPFGVTCPEPGEKPGTFMKKFTFP